LFPCKHFCLRSPYSVMAVVYFSSSRGRGAATGLHATVCSDCSLAAAGFETGSVSFGDKKGYGLPHRWMAKPKLD
jgi:hypothetical protein